MLFLDTETTYIDDQKNIIRKFLEKSQYKDAFNELHENNSKNSFIHILLGVQEYLRRYYKIQIDWNEQSEYIIPNITDETFSKISGNDKYGDYSDEYIDGLIYIDSDGEITSGEDSNISDIIVYQSKSGSGKNNKLSDDIILLNQGIKFLLYNEEKNESYEVFKSAIENIRDNENITVHPVYIYLDRKPHNRDQVSDTLLDNTEILNNPKVDSDLDEILFDKNYVNTELVNQVEKASLKCISVQSFSYPGSMISPYISFVYLRDYINFLNFHKKEGSSNYELNEGLFLKNVRRNVGKNNPLNKKIRDTFFDGPSEQSGDIWWKSNGITIIADSMENQNGTLILKNPSIINGQQTSRQLFNALKKDEEKFFENNPSYSPWKFMIKIFIADTSKEEVSSNIDSIISGLNSQSAISKNSIDIINDNTKKIANYVSDVKRDKPYFLELYSGMYTRNQFYKDHKKKDSIITIETLVQYALSAELNNNKDNENEVVSIGKIRSSRNSIISKYHESIFEHQKDPKFWYNFIHAIKLFEEKLKYDEDDKISGLQYLTFALFRLAYRNFGKENKDNKSMSLFFKEIEDGKLEDVKIKLKDAMSKETDDKGHKITNWDQYSKKEAFESMLSSITF